MTNTPQQIAKAIIKHLAEIGHEAHEYETGRNQAITIPYAVVVLYSNNFLRFYDDHIVCCCPTHRSLNTIEYANPDLLKLIEIFAEHSKDGYTERLHEIITASAANGTLDNSEIWAM